MEYGANRAFIWHFQWGLPQIPLNRQRSGQAQRLGAHSNAKTPIERAPILTAIQRLEAKHEEFYSELEKVLREAQPDPASATAAVDPSIQAKT
jgi:hypothetical protein